MGRPKAKPKSASPAKGQDILVVYKADKQTSTEFKAWLEHVSDSVRAPLTVVIDMALKEFADKRKLKPMPDRLRR